MSSGVTKTDIMWQESYLFTDHKALIHLNNQPKLNAKQARCISFINLLITQLSTVMIAQTKSRSETTPMVKKL